MLCPQDTDFVQMLRGVAICSLIREYCGSWIWSENQHLLAINVETEKLVPNPELSGPR